MSRILVVDDEEGIRSFVAECLQTEGHAVVQAATGDEAIVLARAESFDLVITDLRMPGISGLEVLRILRDEQPEVEVILLTAHGAVSDAVEAMRQGAFDFVQKPVSSPGELRLLAERALERRTLKRIVEHTRRDQTRTPLSYGAPSMVAVEDALGKVAVTDATVLLVGESGTGKEVAARAVHEMSPRAKGAFVVVNCATLSENLLESELFGHEKGAFTGATSRKRGRIELAQGGTFFLDEIGEMKLELQAKLLRVIEERVFERVGGTRTIEADVRWIAATNRNLREQIKKGHFREDLYHRIAVFPVEMPPLRERREDILPLSETLLNQIRIDLKRPNLRLTSHASEQLRQAYWSGNVRELRNALERAAILSDGEIIDVAQFSLEPAHSSDADAEDDCQTLQELEQRAIIRALSAAQGSRKVAAAQLGIGLRTLYDKLKRYGID
ncbi:MAG: sigma-54-dependent Fis family transcriptional regulator [Kofleriaceae bacterium]|nr:sigma-54-dependent Fis family transcriptional regulator [Kofleriaceae bacterium]